MDKQESRDSGGLTVIDLKNKKVLVISPHPDDETLGCGGLLLKAKKLGAETHVLILGVADHKQYGSKSDKQTREEETKAVMDKLGVKSWHIQYKTNDYHMNLDTVPKRELINLIESGTPCSLEEIQPDILLIPFQHSCNQDHQAAYEAALAAARPRPKGDKHTPAVILVYEQPDTQWSHSAFKPNVWVEITDELDEKIEALKLYSSQVHKSPHPVCEEMVRATAVFRGHSVGVKAAEAFFCQKVLL